MNDVFARANRVAALNGEAFVRWLLPHARREGSRWRIGGLGGERGRSLSIDPQTGAWYDHATNERGGDFVSLFAAIRGLGQSEAAEEILRMAGERTTDAPTRSWTYHTATGEVAFIVDRYDGPGGKRFVMRSPSGERKLPAVYTEEHSRPLYRLPELAQRPGDPIVVVEGEKAADAVCAAGFLGTTSVGGAKAAKKTSWAPLAGRVVVIWPDNDDPGRQYADVVAAEAKAVGATRVIIVPTPPGEPPSADAADHPTEEVRRRIESALASGLKPKIFTPQTAFSRFVGAAPPTGWLVENVVARRAVTLLCGEGGIGKGLLALDLAWKVVLRGHGRLGDGVTALGERVVDGGVSVAVLALEDDPVDLHRRAEIIDPIGERTEYGHSFYTCSIDTFGGSLPIVTMQASAVTFTEMWAEVERELAEIDGLALLVLDTLSKCSHVPIEEDPLVANMLYARLGALAVRLNIAIVVTHHMGKDKGLRNGRIEDVYDARSLVRGTSALVDGARCVYTLWPERDHDKLEQLLQQAAQSRNQRVRDAALRHLAFFDERGCYPTAAVVHGAVVKSNIGPLPPPRLFVRERSGLLVLVE
jgi:hypothetical protein